MSRPRRCRSPEAVLVVAFAAVVCAFVGATAYVELVDAAIDDAALTISANVSPSIERLAALRGEVQQVRLVADDYLDTRSAGGTADPTPIEEAGRRLEQELDAYFALPPFRSEQEKWGLLRDRVSHFVQAVATAMSTADRGDVPGTLVAENAVTQAAGELVDVSTQLIDLNAENSRQLAMKIRESRRRSAWLVFGLDALCVAIAGITGALVFRTQRRFHASLQAQARALEERADELEAFAGRVAHDILSPLTSTTLALELARAHEPRGGPISEVLARGERGLRRVRQTVDNLLEFARAGAKPTAGARCLLGPVLDGLFEESREEAASAEVDLRIERVDADAEVACAPGVLTSMAGNLIHNAIKYTRDSEVRIVSVRATERGDHVRIEVEDTGPGLAPGLEEKIFLPYVRAHTGRQPGLGLGLATVRRLAEAHGGAVGVRSVPGRGSLFWVEVPLARGLDFSSAEHDAASERARFGPIDHRDQPRA